jgi:hypothetical protein
MNFKATMVRVLETWLCADLRLRKENVGSTDIPIIPLHNEHAVVLQFHDGNSVIKAE